MIQLTQLFWMGENVHTFWGEGDDRRLKGAGGKTFNKLLQQCIAYINVTRAINHTCDVNEKLDLHVRVKLSRREIAGVILLAHMCNT